MLFAWAMQFILTLWGRGWARSSYFARAQVRIIRAISFAAFLRRVFSLSPKGVLCSDFPSTDFH